MNKEDLKDCLNIELGELDGNLKACQISTEKSSYEESDKTLLKQYRELVADRGEAAIAQYQTLVTQGISSTDALEQLAQVAQREGESAPQSVQKLVKRWKGKVPVALFDLLKAAQKLTEKPIGLSRGVELLQVSGLPEKSEYNREEAEKFLETCDLTINQGKSLAEVARKNGVGNGGETGDNFSAWVGSRALQKGQAFTESLAQKSAVLEEDLTEVYQQQFLGKMKQVFVSGEFDEACDKAREKLRAQRGRNWPDIQAQYRLWLASQEDNTIEASVEPAQLLEGQD